MLKRRTEMALSERVFIDKIEVTENKAIGVRETTIIERDGVEISRTYHRWMFTPGQDVSAMNADVQAVAAAVWTPEAIAAYNAQQAAAAQDPQPL
jgi:hypothetical protein